MTPGSGLVVPDGEDRHGRPFLRPNGGGILLKAAGDDVQGAYSLQEFIAEPEATWVPPHIHHGFEEAFYVLEGELSVQLAERRVSAPAGAFVLITRGTPHSHSNPLKKITRYLVLFS